MKPVIILTDDLPVGLEANFAAVLAMSLGRSCPDLVGHETPAADGSVLPGITTVPVPLLAAARSELPRAVRCSGRSSLAAGLYARCVRGEDIRGPHGTDRVCAVVRP
jgi:hypothetical protein